MLAEVIRDESDTAMNIFALFMQGGLDGRYVGTQLFTKGDGIFKTVFVGKQQGNANVDLPFELPWRVVAIGDLKTIFKTDIVTAVVPESEHGPDADLSWIEPGITSWTWYNGDQVGDYVTYKRYIDLSAEMGWKYVLLDEGWQPNGNFSTHKGFEGYFDWFDDIMDYANKRGVEVLVWTSVFDVVTRPGLLLEWASKGVKGIKVDFFESEDQSVMKDFDIVNRRALEAKLMVNYHGCPTPTGEHKTYPHLVSREGIAGEEQNIFNRNYIRPAFNAVLPFTRNVPGSMDFTPSYSNFTGNSGGSFNGNAARSYAHSTALAVVFENGIPCFSDKPSVYRSAATYDFFRNIPASWDKSILLDGYPTSHAVIARQKGDNWYIGAVNGSETTTAGMNYEGSGTYSYSAKTTTFTLDFLDGGAEYWASIYTDGDQTASTENVAFEYKKVSKGDTITFDMAPRGGAVMKITKGEHTVPATVKALSNNVHIGDTVAVMAVDKNGNMTDLYKNMPGTSSSPVWRSSDPEVADIQGTPHANAYILGKSRGTADIILDIDGKEIGRATITVDGYALSDEWSVRKADSSATEILSPTALKIRTQTGDSKNKNDSNNSIRNVYLTDVADDAPTFEVTAKLVFDAIHDYQTAGITVWLDSTNFVTLARRYHTGGSPYKCFMLISNSTSPANPSTAATSEYRFADPLGSKCYIKLSRDGAEITGYISGDGASWMEIDKVAHANIGGAPQLKAGLYAANGDAPSSGGAGKGTSSATAVFEDFAINNKVVPFAEDNTTGGEPPPLEGSVSISLNANNGALTANTSAVATGTGEVGELTYEWSGTGVTDSGADMLETGSYSLGRQVTLTVTCAKATGSLTATITVYRVNVAASGNGEGDSVSIADAYGKAGGIIEIAYTVGDIGSATNFISFSGGEVNDSGTSPARYTIDADDSGADGVITIMAEFIHSDDFILKGTVNITVDANTGEATALATGGNTGSVGNLTYTWGGGASGIGETATPALGITATCTVTANDATGSIIGSVTVYRVDISLSGNEGTDGASIASPYGKAGGSVSISYTLGDTGTQSNTLAYSGVTGAPVKVINPGSGVSSYTITPDDAKDGVITITAAFEHLGKAPATYSVTVIGSYAEEKGDGTYAPGDIVTIKAGSRKDYTFSGWASSDEVALDNPGNATTTFEMPAADVTVTANWKRNSDDGGGSGGNSGNSKPKPNPAIPPADQPATPSVGTTEIGGGEVTTPIDKPPISNGDGTTTLPGGGTITVAGGDKFDHATAIEVPPGTAITDKGEIRSPNGGSGVVITIGSGFSFNIHEDAVIILDKGMPLGYRISLDNPFKEAGEGDWFFDQMMFAYSHGLMVGTGEGFGPNLAATRGMIITILYRMAGSPEVDKAQLSDVEPGAWYYDAVQWAASVGIMRGDNYGRFNPESNITRQDLTVILNNYLGYAKMTLPTARGYPEFNDASDISSYATEAVGRFYMAKIINGKPDNKFDPKGNATRAEVATMLKGFIETARKA